MCCNKKYKHDFDENLKERFFSANKYSNHEKNKFILFLRKGVFPSEYMDDQEKFNEIIKVTENFYSHLDMENITDADYAHAKRVEISGEYHDLYVQSDILLLKCVLKSTNLILQHFFQLLD